MPNIRREKDYVAEWRSLWGPDLEAIAYNGATCDPTRVDPKVLRWVKNHCTHKPHFIKVINQTASHGWRSPQKSPNCARHQCKLFVPRPFVRDNYKMLGRVCTLENGTTNEKWRVSFGIPQKVVAWLQGWKRVAVGNEIRPGDVMVFILEGDSHFVFHLFDEHGQPKLQSHDPTVKEETTSSSQQADGDPLESDFCSLKKRRLFDPDIVKLETEIINETSEGGEAIATENPHEDSHDPVSDNLYENSISSAGRLEIGTEVAPLPDVSDLEVTVAVPGIVPGMVEGAVDISGGKTPWSEGSDYPLEVREEAGKLQHHGSKMKSVKQVMDVIVRRPPLVQPDSPIDPLAFFITSRRREISHVEKKRPRELAKAHAELLLGYHFVLALSAAQVYRDFYVTLPARFVSDARLSPDLTRMKVVDLHGKEWKMYCRMTSSGTVAFHRKHWGVFSLEHLLEEGDACLFQLKSKGALTMSVRIFRVLQLPKALGRARFSVCEHYDMRAKSNQCRSEVII